jgi:lysophospholipase L1-like esterase
MKGSRREFLANSVVGAIGLSGISMILSASLKGCDPESRKDKLFFGKAKTVVFQGDSITDARRNRNRLDPNDALSFGTGYAFLIASSLLGKLPEQQLLFYNRGVGGNKVYQLRERWEGDCIDLSPDVVSILIGVNDYWHTIDSRFSYEGDINTYTSDYTELVKRTRENLPGVKIIICEPYTVLGKVVTPEWQEGFVPYQKAARAVSEEFGLPFVPFQRVFDEACQSAPSSYWSQDGIHPTMAGSQLMAEAWLRMVQ